MIQIKFHIKFNNSIRRKKIQFSKTREKELVVLYGITKEVIQRNEKSDLDQLVMISCFQIVKQIRKNPIIEVIQQKLFEEWSRHQGLVSILKEIKNISIEAKVDNIPKKILNFP